MGEIEKFGSLLSEIHSNYQIRIIIGSCGILLFNILILIWCCCCNRPERRIGNFIVDSDIETSSSTTENDNPFTSTVSERTQAIMDARKSDAISIDRSREQDTQSPFPQCFHPGSRILSKAKKKFMLNNQTIWKIEKYFE